LAVLVRQHKRILIDINIWKSLANSSFYSQNLIKYQAKSQLYLNIDTVSYKRSLNLFTISTIYDRLVLFYSIYILTKRLNWLMSLIIT
jgi:hypothetical protein